MSNDWLYAKIAKEIKPKRPRRKYNWSVQLLVDLHNQKKFKDFSAHEILSLRHASEIVRSMFMKRWKIENLTQIQGKSLRTKLQLFWRNVRKKRVPSTIFRIELNKDENRNFYVIRILDSRSSSEGLESPGRSCQI